MDKIKNRIEYIDLLKGFGIVLMVIGHIFDRNHHYLKLWTYIYSFHMPLFFFISGFLYRNYDVKDFVIRKFRTLIVPYLFFGLVNFVLSYIFLDKFVVNRYFEHILFFNHKYIGIGSAIWFLTALFFVNVIYILLENLFKKIKYGNILLPVLIFSLGILEAYLKIKLPYSISCAICVLPIFYAGVLFKKYRERINIKGWFIPLLLLVLPLATILLNGKLSVRRNIYNNYFLFLFNSLVTILGYWFIAEKIKLNKLWEHLRYIGVNSLYYMCLNQVVIYVFVKNLNISNTALVFLMTMPILYLCSEMLIKLKTKMKEGN